MGRDRAKTLPAAAPVQAAGALPAPLNALTLTKLHDVNCGFSFRMDYTALNFNVPAYQAIEGRFGINRQQFVVLYSVHLMPGSAAHDICISSGFPKNTISRAVEAVLGRKLIIRKIAAFDRRQQLLYLTKQGSAVVAGAVPILVARERVILSSLTASDRKALCEILARLVLSSPGWSPSASSLRANRTALAHPSGASTVAIPARDGMTERAAFTRAGSTNEFNASACIEPASEPQRGGDMLVAKLNRASSRQ